jgi:hypothetical protein
MAKARERFVDGIIDDLENHVMESGAIIGITDIHSRTFSDCLKTL